MKKDLCRLSSLLLALVLGPILLGAAGDQGVASQATEKSRESQECKLIVNWDEIDLWLYQMQWVQAEKEETLTPEEVKALVEKIVAEHAKGPDPKTWHPAITQKQGVFSVIRRSACT